MCLFHFMGVVSGFLELKFNFVHADTNNFNFPKGEILLFIASPEQISKQLNTFFVLIPNSPENFSYKIMSGNMVWIYKHFNIHKSYVFNIEKFGPIIFS